MRTGFRIVVAALSLCASLPRIAAQQVPVDPGPPSQAEPLPEAPLPAAQSPAASAQIQTPALQTGSVQTGNISGSVTDANGDLVPGANVVIESPGYRATTVAGSNGMFVLENLAPGASYRVTVSAKDFDPWVSPPVAVTPGGYVFLKDIQLKLPNAISSVTVNASNVEMATEQVQLEEKQRIFGIIPNFYVVYDSANAVPLTAKLKFQMAFRASVDPISFLGAAALAGMNQAADTPAYGQGWRGYSQRVGSVYTDGFTDVMLGGAILPTILHQDPRYFYKGTGSIRSRVLHAMAAPFICKGDNGKWQPNYSSVGGDLISASISTAYYPQQDRGASLLFENLLIETAERSASTLIQEFLLRKWTPAANGKN
jgi:hypothetical protein